MFCIYFYICFQTKKNCVVVCRDQDGAVAGNVSPAQVHSGHVFQFSESHTLQVGQESHMHNVLVCRLFCCLFFFSLLFHVVSFIYLVSYLFLFCCFLGGEGGCSDCSKWVEIYPVNVPVHEWTNAWIFFITWEIAVDWEQQEHSSIRCSLGVLTDLYHETFRYFLCPWVQRNGWMHGLYSTSVQPLTPSPQAQKFWIWMLEVEYLMHLTVNHSICHVTLLMVLCPHLPVPMLNQW